jgi:hypothetical protein
VANASEKFESDALSFDTADDALDDARAIVEEANRRLVERQFPKVVELYRSSQLYVLIQLRFSGDDPLDWYLGINAVSRAGHQLETAPTHVNLVREQYGSEGDFVFVGVRNFVESPQGVVPSLVWLARHHVVKDRFRNLFGWPFYTGRRFNLGERVGEGEVRLLSISASVAGANETDVIERGSQINGGVGREPRNSIGQRLSDPRVLNLATGIQGVWLDNHLVRISVEEGLREQVQFGDVILGVSNCQTNAV